MWMASLARLIWSAGFPVEFPYQRWSGRHDCPIVSIHPTVEDTHDANGWLTKRISKPVAEPLERRNPSVVGQTLDSFGHPLV
jgi:hypothetical protein